MSKIVTLTLNPTVDLTWEVEQLDPAGKNRARPRNAIAGGGGINVARGVASLGASPLALHTAGGDVGRRLGRLLDDEGFDHRAIEVAGETREAMILLTTAPGESYHVVPRGPSLVEDEGRACLDALLDEAAPGIYVVLSGSLPDGLPTDFYAQVARASKEAGARVVLDTSGPALYSAIEEGVFLLKPNRREAGELIGRSIESFDDAREANERLLDRGGAVLAVTTLGEHGALCSSTAGHHELHNPPLPSEVLSDAGAGDSLVAGLVATLAAGGDQLEACVLGVAAAAASVLTPGTQLFEPKVVEQLRQEVEVHRSAIAESGRVAR